MAAFFVFYLDDTIQRADFPPAVELETMSCLLCFDSQYNKFLQMAGCFDSL